MIVYRDTVLVDTIMVLVYGRLVAKTLKAESESTVKIQGALVGADTSRHGSSRLLSPHST